jgi:hypothetical protein
MAARTEAALLGGAAALVAAFLISFARGIGGGAPAPPAPPVQLRELKPPTVENHAGRVEVLNGSGRAGLARSATQQLRDAGFDVVFYGNAPASLGDSSVVINRVSSERVARAAAEKLGITRVRSAIDTTLFVDATIVVGIDWQRAVRNE